MLTSIFDELVSHLSCYQGLETVNFRQKCYITADLKIIGLSLDNRLGDWKSVVISVIVILKSMDGHLLNVLFGRCSVSFGLLSIDRS